MSRKGTYYVGRILKMGALDQPSLIRAMKNPSPIRFGGNAWSFIDVEEYIETDHRFVFGRLSKYVPEGEVGVVDMATRSTRTQVEPNLISASSPFVYIPEQSGIVFLNVPGHIEQAVFIKRFCRVIEESLGAFFVTCNIEPIVDLKTFAAKLLSLNSIFKIDARVSPPNPLFGPLWRILDEYLKKRNADQMTIVENAKNAESLNTELPRLVSAAAEQTLTEAFLPGEHVSIGDAAVLMAADGYGRGKIRGRRDGDVITIRTSETTLNFTFDYVPEPLDLYLKALAIFQAIQEQRHMEHRQ